MIFGYQTACNGNRPVGYAPQVFKVKTVTHQRYRQDASNADYSVVQLETAVGLPAIPMRVDLPAVNEQVFDVHTERRGQEALDAGCRRSPVQTRSRPG